MTASVKNTLSAIRVLEQALREAESRQGPPKEGLCHAFNLGTLLNSVRKCVDSLAAQIRFYQSAKSPTRALIVTHDDGREEYVSGQKVQTLCLHIPDMAEDAVIFGKPEALSAIAAALAASGKHVSGPAPIHDLAKQLGATAPGAERQRQP
ncbi:MAG: hypothetical protein AAFY12_12265 [Pseudomonadota bacterium]